ncbi:tryptophan--tRNA ligase [Faecalibacterium sp. An77]|uniref:tryptophan--tRNA ligase n=1 Tax=Faecalibacterium sp. An77 TaxID=1965655 RepID=UPI000B3AB480|nr:tryptophan--tRNA ligase [Faecalibacterium sp. An77]OUN37669.1 tryptophan--tRNA ligase [Faecalibacterium sp. An77]
MSEQSERKRVILSGIQPTGTFTLGNYIGAVRNWAKLQDQFNCLYMVADLHALTVRQDPAALRRNTREAAAMLLAAGIDPAQSILFVQSHVPAHTQLNWILCCNAQFGELSRMTQFKDKSAKHPDNVNGGLFTYPALMAADILIYNADLVPVGQDQTQHLELARNVAQRFNNAYSPTFTLPEGYVTKEGAKIMSLADPTHKMSKSDTNVNAFILLTDDRDTITRKFKRAVTDSDGVVRYDPANKPGVSNLIAIYHIFTGKSIEEVEREFDGQGYGVFKEAVGAAVADGLAPIQGEYARILADKTYVDGVLKEGAAAASRIADRMIQKVYRKVGLLQL